MCMKMPVPLAPICQYHRILLDQETCSAAGDIPADGAWWDHGQEHTHGVQPAYPHHQVPIVLANSADRPSCASSDGGLAAELTEVQSMLLRAAFDVCDALHACRPPQCVYRYPREVPELPWYRSTVPQMVMAGFLVRHLSAGQDDVHLVQFMVLPSHNPTGLQFGY
jgi:hypothetical protein